MCCYMYVLYVGIIIESLACIITGTLLPWTRHLHWHSAEEPGGSHSTVLIEN